MNPVDAALAQARELSADPGYRTIQTLQGYALPEARAVEERTLPEVVNYGLPIAYSRSGPYYSRAGAREGYEDYGLPAPIFQSNPYATAIGRTFRDPYGGLGWQALQGFPSAYPHVLNGVPNNPFVQGMSLIQQMLPPMWPYFPMMGMMPPMQMPRAAQAPAAPAPGGRQAAPAKTAPAKTAAPTYTSNGEFVGPPAPQPDPKYMIPPELRYQPPMEQMPFQQLDPMIGGQIPLSPEIARKQIAPEQTTWNVPDWMTQPLGPAIREGVQSMWEQMQPPLWRVAKEQIGVPQPPMMTPTPVPVSKSPWDFEAREQWLEQMLNTPEALR